MGRKTEVPVVTAPWGDPDCVDKMRQMKDAGVTSIQIYTFWREFEPEKGRFDWSGYDEKVNLIKEAGLKYVPFVLMGPKYAAPDWWLEDKNHVGLKCLEHGRESPIDSIWNPKFFEEIDRVLKAFAEHYMPMDVLESVQPGICGDYGEAIMPVTGNWPGDYHSHRGFWAGDALAAEDFRRWLRKKYGTFENLKNAWFKRFGTDLTTFDEITPFARKDMPSRTAFFDLVGWYRASMTAYADFWMRTCRKYFGDLPVYLCTGGQEEPEHASLFSDQAKMAAKYGGGIRLTNECNKYFENFYLTAYTWSACKFYGAYLGLEPVGPMTPEGVGARMFGSAYYKNRQIFHYAGNLFDFGRAEIKTAASEKLTEYLPLIEEGAFSCETAFFWPGYLCAWENGVMPNGVRAMLTYLRGRTDIMPVNEQMIADGALDRFKLLFIPSGGFTKRETLAAIARWVENGGKLFSVGELKDLELEPVPEYDALFGILPTTDTGTGHCMVFTEETEFTEFSKVGKYHGGTIKFGLSKDVRVLSGTRDSPGYGNTTIKTGANAFLRENANGGAAIMYLGPTEFARDPQALFNDGGAFPAILSDILALYTDSREMETKEGEIVRGNIGGKLYALYPDGSIREV